MIFLIYKKVEQLCRKREISIYRLEKELGFSASSIAKWKVSMPVVDKLKAVADYFGVSIEYFLEDEKSEVK